MFSMPLLLFKYDHDPYFSEECRLLVLASCIPWTRLSVNSFLFTPSDKELGFFQSLYECGAAAMRRPKLTKSLREFLARAREGRRIREINK